MIRHTITITFTSDADVDPERIVTLLDMIEAQVEDEAPMTDDTRFQITHEQEATR